MESLCTGARVMRDSQNRQSHTAATTTNNQETRPVSRFMSAERFGIGCQQLRDFMVP
jgi:hypothetical protein